MSDAALQIIARNKLTKDKTLDLSNCGLEELPPETFDCVWIEKLILNNKGSENRNRLQSISGDIKALRNLTVLRAAGEPGYRWRLVGTDFVRHLPKLEHLDLNYNQIEDISSLEAVERLRWLDLHTNNITDFTALARHTGLTHLDLSDNNTPEVDVVKNFTDLVALSLRQNFITDIGWLGGLTKLTWLNLGINEINDIGPLKDLAGLQTLNLHENRITDLRPLEGLVSLEQLDLRANEISSVEALKGLTRLTFLDLGLNGGPIDVCHLALLVNLERLDLNVKDPDPDEPLRPPWERPRTEGGQQTPQTGERQQETAPAEPPDFGFLRNFTRLRHLGLAGNRVNDLQFLDSLPLIERLDVNNNLLSEIEQLLPLARFTKDNVIFVTANPVLAKLPKEVLEVGWGALHNRLIALASGEAFIDLKEVKLLILGNTNVGKSNLLEYFETGAEPRGIASTHGIQFRSLSNLIADETINCWDFGGQDYFHATYQLFFSPGSVHLVLWSKEQIARLESDVCYDMEYWLRSVEQIIHTLYDTGGAGTDVIVCENKIDLQHFSPTMLNQAEITRRFPRLNMTFTAINLRPLFPELLTALKGLLAMRMRQITNIHPESYAGFIREIRASQANYLHTAEVLANSRFDDGIVLSLLHKMGVILYFPTIIPQKVFHRPQLLLDLLYGNVLSRQLLLSGKFSITLGEVDAAVRGNLLDLTAGEIILLLSHFDLLFRIPKEPDLYFIPQYMPPPPPEIVELVFDHYRQATIIIRSDQFLMNLAMLKVYTQYGRFVDTNRRIGYLFWKDAIVIGKGKAKVLVRFDRSKDQIEICPEMHESSFQLQDELVQFIIGVDDPRNFQDDSPGTEEYERRTFRSVDPLIWYSEKFDVFVSTNGQQFVSWNELVRRAELRAMEIDVAFCVEEETGKNRPLPIEALKQFLPSSARRKLRKKLFICYAHEDSDYKAELKKYLFNHVQNGLLEVWDDGELRAGDDWDKKIRKGLATADICVLLVSQDLITSQYINQVEFRTILGRRNREECLVVPILLRNCDWRNWKIHPDGAGIEPEDEEGEEGSIERFQFLPLSDDHELKPIEKWADPADAWVQIAGAIEFFCRGEDQREYG